MVRKCIKRTASIVSRFGKSPRVHNIIDKSVMILVWTPVIAAVYMQVGLLAYRYSKTSNALNSALD